MSSGAPSDDMLAARIRTGDVDAFETIAAQYYPQLLSFLDRMVGSRAVAEDLVQDIFLSVWRSREMLMLSGSWKVYLYSAARNRLRNHFRDEHRARRRMAPAVHELADEMVRSPIPSDEALEHDELIVAALRAVEALPERAREIWRLHRDHGLTYQEIGAVLGISVNTVKTQMGRSLAAVRRAAAPFLAIVLSVRS